MNVWIFCSEQVEKTDSCYTFSFCTQFVLHSENSCHYAYSLLLMRLPVSGPKYFYKYIYIYIEHVFRDHWPPEIQGRTHSDEILIVGKKLKEWSWVFYICSEELCSHIVWRVSAVDLLPVLTLFISRMCGGCNTDSFVILFCCFPLCFSRPQFRLRLC